jgi:hypothetical protein
MCMCVYGTDEPTKDITRLTIIFIWLHFYSREHNDDVFLLLVVMLLTPSSGHRMRYHRFAAVGNMIICRKSVDTIEIIGIAFSRMGEIDAVRANHKPPHEIVVWSERFILWH